jgi:ribosome maturation factor RimP
MELERIREIITPLVQEFEGFVVELKSSGDGKVMLLVDTMTGIKLHELTTLSRAIEAEMDRESDDFALEVSSPGMDQPFKVNEQYFRHQGKNVRVILLDGTVKSGMLTGVSEAGFSLHRTERVPKLIGKGKMTVTQEDAFTFAEVKETKIEFSF